MPHNPRPEHLALTPRLLHRCGDGLRRARPGAACSPQSFLPTPPRSPTRCCRRSLTFPAKAKHVIHIFANGGCSHVDTFDRKPALEKYAGKPVPNNLPTERKTGAALPSPFKFKKYGQCGLEVSELFANTAEFVDDLASSVRCTPTCRTTSRR